MEGNEQAHLDEALWVPITEQDRNLVREQLERLLETSHFRNSRRYPALFRFIVEETLAGRGEFLKERLLGVKVFGRPTDYDTAADPVVRVTVAEIRKRIAQYYHHESHDSELRIELLPGRYEPEFRPGPASRQLSDGPSRQGSAPAAASLPQTAPLPQTNLTDVEIPAYAAVEHKSRLPWIVGGLVLTVLFAAALLGWRILRPSALEQFWAPMLNAHQPVTICLPVAGHKYGVAAGSKIQLPTQTAPQEPLSPSTNRNAVGPGSFLALESLGENVVFSDVRAMMSLSDMLSQHNAEQRLRLSDSITLDDLRQGPAILIGALDNPWTLRAVSQMRYQFGGNDQEIYWLVDTQTGKPTPWLLDMKTPIASVTRDYAILARIHAEDTGQPEIVVAGIGMSGTAAAGELLSDPVEIGQLKQRIGRGFATADFEAVISTDVVNGIAGPPKILAVEAH